MEKDIGVGKPSSLWRNRDYLLLWLGQAVSSLGTGISQLALSLLILTIPPHSPASAGFALALGQIPFVLFGLPAGAFLDRWERKRVMIVCTIGLTLCLASIPVALALGHLTIMQLYIVAFVSGTLTVFYQLAEIASLTWLVSKGQLTTAVAQNEVVYSTVSLIAPSISTLLFRASQMLPFVADTISYLVMLGSLFNIHTPLQENRDAQVSRHLLREVREGIYWLWSHPVLRPLAFFSAYLYVLLSGSVLIVLVIAQQHGIPTVITGLILVAGGVGNLIGTALYTLFQRRLRLGWALSILIVLYVLLWPLYGFATTPVFLGLIGACLAMTDSIYSILAASFRLAVVPDELQARVGSVVRLISFGSVALGQAMIGLLLQRFGVLATVGILWVGLLIGAIFALANGHIRWAIHPQEPTVTLPTH
nr:MFS transporter [Ktedonobacteraceae bacterium]